MAYQYSQNQSNPYPQNNQYPPPPMPGQSQPPNYNNQNGFQQQQYPPQQAPYSYDLTAGSGHLSRQPHPVGYPPQHPSMTSTYGSQPNMNQPYPQQQQPPTYPQQKNYPHQQPPYPSQLGSGQLFQGPPPGSPQQYRSPSPQPYGAQPPQPYGAPPQPYGSPSPPPQPYGSPSPPPQPYGTSSPPPGYPPQQQQPYGPPYAQAPYQPPPRSPSPASPGSVHYPPVVDPHLPPVPSDLPPMVPQAKVELRISCTNLPNKDILSKSDPRVHVYLEKAMSSQVQAGPGLQRRSTFVKQWVELGQTETVKDNLNPVFNTPIPLSYFFESTQLLRIVIVDVDDYKATAPAQQQDFLGYIEVPLASIVQGSRTRPFERHLIGDAPPGMGFVSSGVTRAHTITAAQAAAGARGTSGANELVPGARGAGPAPARGSHLAMVRVSADELPDAESEAAKTSYLFRLRCEKLDKKDLFGSSDPYIVISKMRTGGGGQSGGSNGMAGDWVVVHKTETIMNNLNPTFKEFNLPAVSLTGGDPDRPLLWEVYDFDKNSAHDLIGRFVVSIKQMLGSDRATGGKRYDLIDEAKRAKKGRNYTNSGVLVVDHLSQKREFSFLDYVASGVEMSLAVAVDFTASNGDPRQPTSLHFRDPSNNINSYQRALLGVGQVLEPYDTDKAFPAYGFGAKIPIPGTSDYTVSHLFPLNLNPSNPHVVGVDGLMEAYGVSLNHVVLHGPTNFAPTLRSVNEWAKEGSIPGEKVLRRYSVLLIVTDGAISDIDDTIAAIVDSSSLPISVVIVGVGNADFSSMELLDADKGALRSGNRVAERDCVQFVPFKDYPHQITLSQATLAEIPKQFVDYCRARGLVPAGDTRQNVPYQ
ncbi:Copine-domain-containing protein [Gonapodya prolifera JEL478]|uniref:Copine-domain-containing protein n=1 Tax=Gonapodya prolifera (strain JEL478) TaxID=1344416 RepID=A0A139B0P6_GONPJ|nr:Copine-domain-containing protein [Gonapodya prolifera JEL478]|eukprot:KXS22568.1 Copine-domain-containing protein [Gonapodya prolifera JEL478]